MTENEVSEKVLGAAFKVHTALGPGLFESVYEVVLAHELRRRGLEVERQVPIPIHYDGITFEEGFRADLIVGGLVIVELKAVETPTKAHHKQLLTQLRLSGKRLGLLLNFSVAHLRDGISRIANGLPSPPPPSIQPSDPSFSPHLCVLRGLCVRHLLNDPERLHVVPHQVQARADDFAHRFAPEKALVPMVLRQAAAQLRDLVGRRQRLVHHRIQQAI